MSNSTLQDFANDIFIAKATLLDAPLASFHQPDFPNTSQPWQQPLQQDAPTGRKMKSTIWRKRSPDPKSHRTKTAARRS